MKNSNKPITLLIERILPDSTRIFDGNIKVTIESYTVIENAGEEGDYWVEFDLQEYVETGVEKYSIALAADGVSSVAKQTQREGRTAGRYYTVKSGDSLWSIAKRELNDALKFKTIAELNSITDYYNLQVGMVLRLEN